MRENFHLSCRGKAKEGNFLSSHSKGGGRGVSPRKIFEKRMQMVHSEPIFAEFGSISPKKLCVIFAFKTPISMMREIFFPFAWGGGSSSYFFEKRIQMIHSESIHSRLLVGFFFFFFFFF